MGALWSKQESLEIDTSNGLPEEAIQVWKQVAESAKSDEETKDSVVSPSTVKAALQFAEEYLATHSEARVFVEQHLHCIVDCILSEECPNRDSDEYDVMKDCLEIAAINIAKYINVCSGAMGLASVLTVLESLLRQKGSNYYENVHGQWTWYPILDKFYVYGGFWDLKTLLASSDHDGSVITIDFLSCIVNVVLALSKESPIPESMQDGKMIVLRLATKRYPIRPVTLFREVFVN